MNYKNHIGDGKLPNRYWVFQYDEEVILNEDGEWFSNNDTELQKDSFLGEFKTYKDALKCVDTVATYPHRVIEDRVSGQIFESIVIVCPCCGKKEYKESHETKYTKEFMEKNGVEFE
jgi:hypothetical protein